MIFWVGYRCPPIMTKKNVNLKCSICGRTTEHMYVESTGKYVCSVCGHAYKSITHFKTKTVKKAKSIALDPVKEMVEKAKEIIVPKED